VPDPKYPHAPECLFLLDGMGCSCGATQRNADYEAGRAEGLDRYIKALYASRSLILDLQDGVKPTAHQLATGLAAVDACIDSAEREERTGQREADARARAVVEAAISWAEDDAPVTPVDDALFEALVAGNFIDKEGRRL
jgi:hypothetical protein